MSNEDNLNSTREKNADLVFNYIEHSLQATSDSISKLDTRISTLIGFSGLLLRFTIDLPSEAILDSWNVAPSLKIMISVLLAMAIFISVLGLFPRASGDVYTAEELLAQLEEECKDQYDSKIYIAISRDRTIYELDKLRLLRVRCLTLTTILSIMAMLLFALDIVLSSAQSLAL